MSYIFDVTDIPIVDGSVSLLTLKYANMFPSWFFPALQAHTPWEHRPVIIGGQKVMQPRLICWYGEHSYTYSGLRLRPRPLTDLIDRMRILVEQETDAKYNGVLLNYYRNHRDSIGFHSDDEPEFGTNPTIASLSFGAERILRLKHKRQEQHDIKIPMPHGSILVMRGETQHHWKHGINKSEASLDSRISLTFRNIINPQENNHE